LTFAIENNARLSSYTSSALVDRGDLKTGFDDCLKVPGDIKKDKLFLLCSTVTPLPGFLPLLNL
jgi:hypothetical protein